MAFYYVSPTGSNANSGTNQSSPWQTLAFAYPHLTPGDTLWVMPGTYAEYVTAGVPSGTSWANKIRIAALTPGTALLFPPVGGFHAVIFSNNESYIEWDGIDIDAANVERDGFRVECFDLGGGNAGFPHHIRCQNCTILGSQLNTGSGSAQPQSVQFIDTVGGSTGFNELLNCVIRRCGGNNDFAHGVYVSSSDNTLEGNDISDFLGAGLQVYNGHVSVGGLIDASRNKVRRNTIHDNRFVFNNRGWGVTASSGVDNEVSNNLIFNIVTAGPSSGGGGLNVFTGTNCQILNNTVAGCTLGITLDAGATSCDLINNIAYGNDLDYRDNGSGNNLDAHNLIGVNPLFANVSTDDYSLQAGSVAINAGLTLAGIVNDRLGFTRPFGAAYDYGAYEYGAGGGGSPDVPADGAIVVFDTCTGAVGNLTSHVGEIGAQWNTQPGSFPGLVITAAGHIRGDVVGQDTFHFASGIPLSREYDVSADYYTFSITADHTYLLWGRMDTAQRTGYMLIYNLVPFQFDLYAVINNVYNLLDSAVLDLGSIASPATIRLELRDALKQVFINDDTDALLVSMDNSVTSAGRCGIGIYCPVGGTPDNDVSGIQFDRITLQDTTTGPDVPPAGGDVFLQDTFTDTAGTSLIAHNATIPAAPSLWQLQANTGSQLLITPAGRARGDGLGFGTYPIVLGAGLPATPSYDLTSTIQVLTLIPNNLYGWWVRASLTETTGYRLAYDSIDGWTFYAFIAGAGSLLGAFTLALAAGPHTIEIRGRIPVKQVYVDGVRYLDLVDESIPAAGRIAISAYEPTAASTNTTSVQFDSITGTNVATVIGNPLLTWLPATMVVQGRRGAAVASGYTPRNGGTS